MASKKVLIPVLAAIVAAAIAGGGAWFYAHHGAKGPATAAAVKPDPVAVALKPFTVNLAGDDGRLLYVAMTLQAGNPTTAAAIKAHTPEVRNAVLMILSDQTAAGMLSPAGKAALQTKLSTGLTEAFRKSHTGFVVDKVFFTQFIVQ
ncbi:MAG TPA: flagellar basal body-associated FliL family protein [Nevskiaceae bacterium]|nr:flagellar basal body-associated FliL family protein [Nevskiaceae bacterium]